MSFVAHAQHQELYSNHSATPEGFANRVAQRYQDVKDSTLYEAREVRISALQNTSLALFYENMMLKTGSTVFNEQVDDLVRKVGQHIISSNRDLIKGEVHFHVTRNAAVNAFATDQGYIWITAGLLSKIRTEAQLAFVMCHELSHYIKQHALEGAIRRAKINMDRTSLRYMEVSSKDAMIHGFSQSLEIEADKMGFEMYVKAGYNIDAIPGCFDILSKAVLPHNMGMPQLIFPFSNLSYKDVADISLPAYNKDSIEKLDDNSSTHPSLFIRRGRLQRMVSDTIKNRGKDYIATTPHDLKFVAEMAEYSLGFYFVRELNFAMAISHNQMLLQKYPDDVRIQANILKGWIGLYMSRQRDVEAETNQYYTRYGETYIYAKYSKKMLKRELLAHILAGSYALYQSDTSETAYRNILLFSFEVMHNFMDSTYEGKAEFVKALVKDKDHLLYDYINGFDEGVVNAMSDEIRSGKQTQIHANQDFVHEGVLFLNPTSYRMSQASLLKIELDKSDALNDDLEKNLGKISELYKMKHAIVSANKAIEEAPQSMDDIYTASLLLREQSDIYGQHRTSQFTMLAEQSQLNQLKDRYGCRYIAFTSTYYYKQKVRFAKGAGKVYLSVVVPLAIPGVIANHVMHRNVMEVYMMVYDLQTNNFIYISTHEYRRTNMSLHSQRLFLQYEIHKMLESGL